MTIRIAGRKTQGVRLFEVDGEEKVVSVGVIRDVDDGHDTEDNKTSGEPQDAETDGSRGEQTTE